MVIKPRYDKQEYVIKITGTGKRSAIAKSLQAIARSLQDSHSSWSTLEDATLCAEISELEAEQDKAADEIVDRILREDKSKSDALLGENRYRISPEWQKRLHDMFMAYPTDENDYREEGLDKVFDEFGRRGNIVYEPDESCLSYEEQDKLRRLIPKWRTDQTAYMEILELVLDHASIWAGEEPTMYCHECGDTVFYGEGNVLHHEDSLGGIDHEKDEDHTPHIDGGE